MKNHKFTVAIVSIITIMLLGFAAHANAQSAADRMKKDTIEYTMQNQVDAAQRKLEQKTRDYIVLQEEFYNIQSEQLSAKRMNAETEKLMNEIKTFADKCYKNSECKSAVEKFGPKFK